MSHQRIHQLSTAIANQIAAGEVIERPASVVKELLENALDADATAITIDINFGGLNHIKVSDNGSGIWSDDLLLAVAPHATSKISVLDDLYSITSMGFRGEALASIASISRMSIASKPREQAVGMKLGFVEGQITLMPCARAPGTTIEVCDIFFNAPIRKKFLKSEISEFKAIEQCVKRFALGAAHTNITLIHNEKTQLQLKAGFDHASEQERIAKVFGKAFMQHAIVIKVNENNLSLQGWVSGVGYQRNQNDKIWVYINGRIVRDKLISHAIKVAYEALLFPDKYPSCLLYLTLNPADVDVNVHPTKHEVRFQQPRLIHDFIRSSLKRLLSDETPENNYFEPFKTPQSYKIAEPATPFKSPLKWDNLSTTSSANFLVLNKSFAIINSDGTYYLIDVVNFHKEWLYRQLKTSSFPLPGRPLLVPVTMKLSDCNEEFTHEKQQLLIHLGLNIEFSQTSIIARTIPIDVPEINIREFLGHFLTNSEQPDFDQALRQLSDSQTFNAFQLDAHYCQEYCISLKLGTSSFQTKLTEESCRRLFL